MPLLDLKDFVPLIQKAIGRFAQKPPNPAQLRCVEHPLDSPLMIVAGPGSGKTTVLVLRALRMVYVDGLLPEEVLLTTFTVKAAAELRARLIEWGLLIRQHLLQHGAAGVKARVERIDINRFVTGTLDSICQEALTSLRGPTDPAPVLLEGFVGNAFLRTKGLVPRSAQFGALDQYLADYNYEGEPPANFGERISVTRSLIDRFVHDRVDIQAFRQAQPKQAGRDLLVQCFLDYRAHLSSSNQLDFANLEERFLERLTSGSLSRFTENVRAVLVDEYQDTNPLQESIYFEIVRKTSASYSIVGDDDQSLYRFRGATVELFRDFVPRFAQALPHAKPVQVEHLSLNYRSTPEITDFFNALARNDPAFAPARVQPPKPLIVATEPSNGVPVLGMFRPDAETLAADLTSFLWDVFRGSGRAVPRPGSSPVPIRRDAQGGDFGDAVFLSHTVNELTRAMFGRPPRERLPLLLRNQLAARGTKVFNPRGRALRDIQIVQQLMGTVLDCIDPPTPSCPDGSVFADLVAGNKLRSESRTNLPEWRKVARAFRATSPVPNLPHTLDDFVQAWGKRNPQGTGMKKWPDEWPLLELCFKLLCWFPELHDDPEGQVYLEAVARCITQASVFSTYRSQIVHNQGQHDRRSVEKAILDVMVPLAEGDVDVDEDIMPFVPRDRLQFMTIHQAKGLEFPLVIVDVTSDYKTNSPKNRFRRFPETPGNVQHLEDDLARFSAIGPLRTQRPGLERSFDDLIRLYYVAYSRPQSVLLLVGLDTCLQHRTSIRHVGTFWRMDETWAWAKPHSGKKPPGQADQIPLTLI